MIAIDQLKPEDVGRGVVYRAHDGATPEDGTIVRWTRWFVFVLYKGDTTPKATSGADLEWLSAAPEVNHG